MAGFRQGNIKETVGTGMTGPPGPVIPCTTFRAWSPPFPAAGTGAVFPASAGATVDVARKAVNRSPN